MQMLLATKSTLQVLEKTTKQQNNENDYNTNNANKIDLGIEDMLITKKKEYKLKIGSGCADTKKKSINNVVSQHNRLYNEVNRHIEKEINSQESNFKKAMRERRSRSINRSMRKSINKNRRNDVEEDTRNILSHLKLDSGEKIENPFES